MPKLEPLQTGNLRDVLSWVEAQLEEGAEGFICLSVDDKGGYDLEFFGDVRISKMALMGADISATAVSLLRRATEVDDE